MSRIRRMSYVITPEGHRANAIKQAADLRDKVLSIVDDSNFSTSTARKITKKAAFSVVMRSLEESKGLPLSLREHLAMKELNSYIALAKHNKSDFFYAANADLLPISHPRSTREHSMTASALRISRSRWFAADPRITDDKAKAVLASAFESIPGSVEHLYYTSILLSLPQGMIPGDALIAASDGNSFESRSARARRQRRDRKGQFAYEGGGIRALIRRLNGDIFSISGRVVANAKNSRDVEVEFPDGKIAQVNPAKGEYIKAVLPTPDGYSPKPIVPSASDEVINEKDLVFLDAPNGWVKDEAFKDFGDKVERYVDSNKEFVVFVSKKDDGTKDYQILNAKSAEEIDVVNTWADVQDRLEGKEDQILNPKARLPKQQAAPVETKGGFEYNYPDNAYKIRQDSEYDVQGRVDEESPDFTDDPVELAQKQDERDLLAALEQAVSPGEDGENALGVGALPFGKGDEFVPAEAIFFALQEAGMDAPMELAKIYDKKLGDNVNEKALNDFRKKEEIVSGNTPELAESFKKVTEQNPDLEPPTEEPKFDAKKADSAPLPALLEGLSEKELEQFVETKDHIPYLPKNEEIEMPQGYNPLSPEPFAAWKEVTAENPDAVLPEGFSDNPVYLAQEIPTNDLLKELRRSVEPGNEVPGAAVIALPTEDGEDFVANVPGEAVRDALQLKGVDTNAELKKIADEGFVGQREEPVANIPPAEATGKEIYERRIATGDSLDKVAKELGIPREEVRRLEAEYARTLDKAPEKPTGQLEDVAAINVNSPTLQEDIQSAIDKGQKIAFSYDGKNRVVLPKSIWINPKNDNVNLRAVENGTQKNFTLDKMEMAEGITTPAKSETNEEPQAELPLDAPAEKKPMNAYERLMAENKAEAEAVEERVAKLKKDAEDRVDEQGRSVPEGWGFIAKNRPNFGQVDRPDNYFNVYGNNNFEASIDADGKITIKDRNGLLPDKSYDNWEDLQADLENQKSEYSSAARERVREIAKKYGYSDEQIAAFDSMSQQELADFFANPENHTQAYADALDDLANSSAIDLPNAQQKARWAQMRKDEKILAQAGDGLEGIDDNQDIQEPQEIDNIPVEQEKLDDSKPAEDKTYVEENPEVIKVNAFVEANAGRLAPIKARDVKRGDFLWNNFNKVYEEILDIQPAAFGRVRFLIKDPRNQKEYFRFFDRRSPIRNMRRPGSGEVSEGFKVAPEENRGDGPKRGRALRQPLEQRVEVVAGRDVGGFAYKEGFYKDKNGIVLKPGDKVRHGNPKKDELYGEGVVLVRAGDQIDEAKKVGGIGRGGKVYKDYVWVQIPGEAGPRLWKARMIVKQEDNAGAEEAAPDAIANDKLAVPLIEPAVRKDKNKDLEEQIRRAMDAGDEVSFNYNGKTRYVKPVKIWKNPVNDNVNITAIENGEIKNFTISKMGYIEDPEGAALKRPEVAPAQDASPREPKDGMPEQVYNNKFQDINDGNFEINLIKIGDVYEGALINKDTKKVQIVVRDTDKQKAIDALADARNTVKFAANGDEAMADVPNLDKVSEAPAVELINARSPGVDAMTYENLVAEIKKMRLMLPKARADVADWEEDKLKSAGKQLDKFMRGLKNKNVEGEDFLKTSTYELRQAIAHLNRSKEPLAIEMSEKLTKIYQDFKAKRDAEQIALDAERAKKAAEPLPEGIWPDADAVTSENLAALFAELEVRMLDGGGYNSRDAKTALLILIEQLKKGIDPQGLDSERLQRLYSGLSKSTDAKHVEWAQNLKPIIEKLAEDKKKREAANRQANIDFIDPIAKAEERISAGENAVDTPNIKEVFAKDDVFTSNPFLEPFKEELQNFFALEQPQPLAKLSSRARQALNQYLSGALRDDKALVGATPDQTDKNIREVANLILALRAEELAYSPNRNSVGVAQGLKDIDPDKIFKYGRAKASSSFVPLIIDGVDTGFLIKLNENGVNARNGNNFWLIDTKTGQKLIIKKETVPGRANAEVWAAKLLNVFGVRGVSHVERHPQDEDIIFVTFAGDNLDLVDTPNVYDKVRSKLRLDAKSTAARAKVADLIGMMIFDGVASNTDRHEENFLAAETPENGIARNGNEDLQLLPIDHGFAHRLSRNRGNIYDPETLLRTNGFYTSRDIYKELIRSIGGRATHHLIDLTVQQAIQELKRDNGGIVPAVLNDIISQLEVLRGIAPQKWAKDMGARE